MRDADITNLSVVVRPGATLRVEAVEGFTNKPFASAELSLSLNVLDSMPNNFVAIPRQLDSSGTLFLENIPEARYGLSLSGLQGSAYVSDVRQDGRSIFDDGLLLQESSNPIQILVSQNGGTVSGRIRNSRGSTRDTTVVLVPPLARRKNAALYKTATVNDDGTFIIRGIAPGTYSVVPLESRPAGEPWLNSEFLATYEGRGRTLQITAASTVQVDFN